MSNLIAIIDEIIHTSLRISQSHGTYKLEEKKTKSYPVTNLKTKGKVAVFSFEMEGVNLFPFWGATVSHIRKVCDYFVFCEKDQKCFLFLIELKSKNIQGAFKQIYSSQYFAEYLNNKARVYDKLKNKSALSCSQLEIRGIIVSTKNVKKVGATPKVKYEEHPHYDFKYYHHKAGRDLLLDMYLT